jgi:hypothetical protein
MFLEEWKSAKTQQIKSRFALDFGDWEANNAKFEAKFERLYEGIRLDRGESSLPSSLL